MDEEDVTVEILSRDCLWLKNALSFKEQSSLADFIKNRVKEDAYTNQSAMIRSPKTLPMGKESPCVTLAFDDESPVSAFVKKAGNVLRQKKIPLSNDHDLCRYSNMSVAAIRYASPDGRFPPHVDHCNDGSFVCLVSLGLTARFSVKSPKMERKRTFAFCSGDVIIFDPSSEAAILHAVEGIEEKASATGRALQRIFPGLLNGHRIGLQCRVYFKAK